MGGTLHASKRHHRGASGGKLGNSPTTLTYIFNIRQGVKYALNPDSEASRLVNGRELTAYDVEHTFHRLLGNKLTGTEFSARPNLNASVG